ncbi:MAG: hypothetical protein M0R80_02130 [Proteobacteria bacterium]|jgi:hypothetical protein|nr:hypothetical protein [Pseudomonadota bacterium]
MANSSINKDISSKEILLGQFPTPDSIADFCLARTEIKTEYIIEPSCGVGVFVDKIKKKFPDADILGIEIDSDIVKQYHGKEFIMTGNFYDFIDPPTDDGTSVTFIGNPPFRSPAYSLSERKPFVKNLMKKYGITNMREESVIFLVHTVDLILLTGKKGYIHYILPKAIFDNNSKAYLSFKKFLKQYATLISVWDLPKEFPGVNRDLVYVSFEVGTEPGEYYFHNGKLAKVADFYHELDYIPFQKIFKKTNLGSVPCESIFLSIKDEPLEHFQQRLCLLFTANPETWSMLDYLTYEGHLHLVSLGKADKRKVVANYVKEIKTLPGFSLDVISDIDNYKPIQHRNENRWYFRHPFLKKGSFVYELNRDPCPSFYFPGNPNKGSTDYFGYCEFDVNRNSSPGANRTVPIDGVEDNLQDDFKVWWRANTDLDYKYVFEYILHISRSAWYKNLKKTCQRFYFGIPKEFDKSFLEAI